MTAFARKVHALHPPARCVILDRLELLVGRTGMSVASMACAMTLADCRQPDVEHAASSPCVRAEGPRWTEDASFDLEHATRAPASAGVLVLLHGTPLEEVLVWVENVRSLRMRACELLSVAQRGALAPILELPDLRFRCAITPDPELALVIARGLGEASGHAPPIRRSTLVFYEVDEPHGGEQVRRR